MASLLKPQKTEAFDYSEWVWLAKSLSYAGKGSGIGDPAPNFLGLGSLNLFKEGITNHGINGRSEYQRD